MQHERLAGGRGMLRLSIPLLSCSQDCRWPAMQITIDVTEPIK